MAYDVGSSAACPQLASPCNIIGYLFQLSSSFRWEKFMDVSCMHLKSAKAPEQIDSTHFNWTDDVGIHDVGHYRDMCQRPLRWCGLTWSRERL
jgi:hypothetical protein